jgi:hypothetical protein
MICGRCDGPILSGQEYEALPVMTNSGPGLTVFLHAVLCTRARIQTAPASSRGLIRES